MSYTITETENGAVAQWTDGSVEDCENEVVPMELKIKYEHNRNGQLVNIRVLVQEEGAGDAYARDWTEQENLNSVEKFLIAYPTLHSILEEMSCSVCWEGSRRLYIKSIQNFEGIYDVQSFAEEDIYIDNFDEH